MPTCLHAESQPNDQQGQLNAYMGGSVNPTAECSTIMMSYDCRVVVNIIPVLGGFRGVAMGMCKGKG